MKTKYLIRTDDNADYLLIDKTDDGIRTLKLKADKGGHAWTDLVRGKELTRMVDDGDGFTWTNREGLEVRLRYDIAAELLVLLEHLDETGNYFCFRTKTKEE